MPRNSTIDRQQHDDGARRRRNAGEEICRPGRPVRIVDHHIEARKPQARADREHQRRDPADVVEVVQAPEIEDQRRRHAEIDEVGEAVELGAEPRRALEQARDAAVDAIEHRGEHDRRRAPSSSLPSNASRIAVSPAHSASSVIRFGSSVRTGIGRKRRRRDPGRSDRTAERSCA